MIQVLQIGFGPLGIQTAKYIAKKETAQTVVVVDINPDLADKSLNDISQNFQKMFLFSVR